MTKKEMEKKIQDLYTLMLKESDIISKTSFYEGKNGFIEAIEFITGQMQELGLIPNQQ